MTAPADPVSTTLSAHGGTYGDFADVARCAQSLLGVMKDNVTPLDGQRGWHQLPPVQREALQMICTKLARILNGDPNHIDSWHDIAGYATLVEMELGKDVRVPNTAPGGVTYVDNKVDPK